MHLNTDLSIQELLPFFFIGIGLFFIALAFLGKKKNSHTLQTTGIKAEGIVYSVEQNTRRQKADIELPVVYDGVTVRFTTEKGEWITEKIQQDFSLFFTGQYKNGQKLELYYDPENPRNFHVVTGQSPLIARTLFLIVGLAFLVYGIYTGFFAGETALTTSP